EEQDLLDGVHRFAAEVMRPIGERLDRMTPEEVIAAGSPLWQVFTEFAELGIGVDQLLAFEPAQAARIICLILEELGWGDAGLAGTGLRGHRPEGCPGRQPRGAAGQARAAGPEPGGGHLRQRGAARLERAGRAGRLPAGRLPGPRPRQRVYGRHLRRYRAGG